MRFMIVSTLAALLLTVPAAAQTYAVAYDGVDDAEELLLLDDPAMPSEIGSGFANCCSVITDLSAIDEASGRLYFVAQDIAQKNLYWFDLATGATGSRFIGFFNYYWLAWDSDNTRVLTIYNNTMNAEWRLATLDPSTGGPTNIGNAFATCCTSTVAGAQGLDPDGDRFYFLGRASAGDTTSWRVYGINTSTGAIDSDHTLPTGNQYHYLEYDQTDDTLYILYRDGTDTEQLAVFDPGTGSLGSPIGSGIGSCCNTPAGSQSSIDPGRGVIRFIGTDTSSGDRRLFTIELDTGVASNELLTTDYSWNFLEMRQSVFGNGFESGDTTAWSSTVP